MLRPRRVPLDPARDLACLLDLDAEAVQWSPAPSLRRDGKDDSHNGLPSRLALKLAN
jgi:hypothetical protein